MSTLKVTNIQATGETASRAVSGVAGALAKFNGQSSPLSLDSSQNVSSLTDIATGRPQINFTTSFSNSNFHTTAIAQARCIFGTQSVAASNVLMRYSDYSATDQDREHCSVTVHGDLA
jgi:hypothetical protein